MHKLLGSYRRALSRRRACVGLAAAWVVTRAGLAAAQAPAESKQALLMYKGADRDRRVLERARQEGVLSLYTSLAPTEAKPLVDAFEAKYGVKVQLWRGLSDGIVRRVLTEAQANRHAVDVIETNGPEMESLYRERMLAEFFSPHLADIPAAAIPAHRQWVSDRLNHFVVAYNTNKVKREELPKTYEGFLDPKWKGRLSVEATDAEWMAGIVKLWGEPKGLDFFRKLAQQKVDVRKSHVLLAQLIAAGELEVGLSAYQHNVAPFKKRGAPIEWMAVEPVIARPQGLGISRHAPHPHAALLFADFVLSPEGQAMLVEMGRTPSSRAVKSDTDGLKFTMSDPAVTLDENDKWQKLWDQLFIMK